MKMIKTYVWMVSGIMLAGTLVTHGDDAKDEYASLEGAKRFDVAYDLRNANPKQAALFLRLIHEGFHDDSVRKVTDTPHAAIVINGTAVRLIGESDTAYTKEEKLLITEIDARIKAMAKDGIRIEVCLMAAKIFKVDAATFPSDVKPVENAWISLVGYQGKGYSLIPVF
jgi:intracellular sulfur oxidation DsrE/DsrF family protein